MGPHPGSTVLEGLKSGQFLQSLEVCPVGDHTWTPVTGAAGFVLGVASILPKTAPNAVPSPMATPQGFLGWPPLWHLILLGGIALLGALISVAEKHIAYVAVAVMAVVVYVDAWIAGIRRRPNDKSAENMSPMGWAIAALMVAGLPVYAVVRGKIKTRAGNPVLKVIVFVGALVPVGLVVALALWVFPSMWKDTARLVGGQGVAPNTQGPAKLAHGDNGYVYFPAEKPNVLFNSQFIPLCPTWVQADALSAAWIAQDREKARNISKLECAALVVATGSPVVVRSGAGQRSQEIRALGGDIGFVPIEWIHRFPPTK